MTQRSLSFWEATEPAWPIVLLAVFWFAIPLFGVGSDAEAGLLGAGIALVIMVIGVAFGRPGATNNVLRSWINPQLALWGAVFVIAGGLASQLGGNWKDNGFGVLVIGVCYIVVGGAAWLWANRRRHA